MAVLLCWLAAPFFRRRERRRRLADQAAFFWAGSMVAQYGSDRQLDDWYSSLHREDEW